MSDSTKIGTWMSAGSPAIVELAAECGLDWVLLDLEHGEYGESRIADLLRCLRGSRTLGIVRVPGLQPDVIGRVLDRGADGIMVPHVESAEMASDVVAAMRYAPTGKRGVSRSVRSYGYGTRRMNDRPPAILLAQIECTDGLANSAAIAKTDGVDALFIGPADLRHALKHQPSSPDFETAVQTIHESAVETGKASGILVREPKELAGRIRQGMTWIARGSDLGLLKAAYESFLQREQSS
ncbi:Alpha-dehydro-beta-deoxy-D-glucarate aldolase [Planctomycetales bacterium 10988]|nr:Alpha-dehydro-beta-deoxy-D-glucarate aldolase [Planctomycetales bacterium 10988]